MRLVRRNGNSMEDVVIRALHLRLRLRFASLILVLYVCSEKLNFLRVARRDASEVPGSSNSRSKIF